MVNREIFTSEQLAYWFFRLNGCLTIVNFVLHSEDINSLSQRTDADILALRYPYRKELIMSGHPMQDHQLFDNTAGKSDLIIAEVKRGRCNLNGPWTNPSKRNIDRVLYAIGAFPENMVEEIAQSLYERGRYEGDSIRLRLVAIGRETNQQLEGKAVQLTWSEITRFIFERFKQYRRIKSQHEQWDECGRYLFRRAVFDSSNLEEFQQSIAEAFGL